MEKSQENNNFINTSDNTNNSDDSSNESQITKGILHIN